MNGVSWDGFRVMRNSFLLILFLSLAGCASLPDDYTRTESHALQDYRSTSFGARFAELEAEHPGESGFSLVRYGRMAFNTRIGMIDLAEKTVDLQVYIWEVDETGLMLVERILRAARRGVRVRLLIDDLGAGLKDEGLATLNAFPNIEVRLFNPFANRDFTALDFLTDLDRLNHRMHNKSVIVDNAFAVVGGRNIANHYFSVNQETNFRDLDIAAVGPVVRETSRVFDHYWASDSAVPVAALIDEVYDNAWLANKAEELRKDIATGNYPYALDKDVDELWSKIDTLQHSFIWAPGTIVWDDPDVIDGDPEVGTPVIERLRRKLDTVDQSLFIESAYFVVGDGGVEQIRDMTARGVHVRVLTNSLVSNDVLAAHASYRRDLIEAGAEMYELRADSEVIKKTWVGESRAGLHTKALVFDEKSLFVGSFNLDPRSANINTEAGLYVESPELAARLLDYMDEGVELRFDADPLSTFWERLQSGVIGLLPIESQL